MRKSTILLAVALAVVSVLPLLDHADQANCTSTSSLASTVNNPVSGDEDFLDQRQAPGNVMFLLDTSMSMEQLPQCGDLGWGSVPTCAPPAFNLTAPTSRTTSPTYTVAGTCTPGAAGFSDLAWMESVKPQTAYPDPGRTNELLWDCPPWGNGGPGCGAKVCSGNGCLFDPNAYYGYGDWSATGGGGPGNLWPTATRRQLDPVPGATATLPAPCVALDDRGNVITDAVSGRPADLGQSCRDCMASHGFYLYQIKYFADRGSQPQTVTRPLFKGTFLNANPPKFVTARQVIKANAWMDPVYPRAQDQLRLGLAILDSTAGATQKAQLIVPLGPHKTEANPPTQAGFRQARQYLLSVLNYDKSKYQAGAKVICDGSTTEFQNGFFNPTGSYTPLASALLNLGQYFAGNDLYTTVLGGYTTSAFNETSAGRTNAPWASCKTDPSAPASACTPECSICWACQASSVVLITDGSPSEELPQRSFPAPLQHYDDPGYGLAANCGSSSYAAEQPVSASDTTFRCKSPFTGNASGLPRVADWLHTLAATGNKLAGGGLRSDLALSGGQQAFRVSAIGINLTDPAAKSILRATANLGNGFYANAKDPDTLAKAVASAVNLATPKQISFASASSSSLQTVQTTASQAFITRFRSAPPGYAWEGHVYETFLFDEFLNGCDPTKPIQPTVSCGQAKTKQVSADFDGDGQCSGTFLIDLDCDRIVEDSTTGDFLKRGTKKRANLSWDAGQVLSFETLPSASGPNAAYRSADESRLDARKIFTWIDGQREEFTSANAAKILPYLNVGWAWCSDFLSERGIPGGANPTLECARQIIWYVRGFDVLDQDGDGCAGPNGPRNVSTCQRGAKGEERDRPMDAAYATTGATAVFWKLGDVVHSSPAVLQAPIDELRCDTGYEKQCTWAIHSPPGIPNQTPMDTGCTRADCYQEYRNAHLDRQRVLLVGANDGMLHAFDAGSALIDRPKDLTGSYAYDNGTGAELWAFIPPDMLPRLKDLLRGHQYMVDGSVMLRDVWVDGTAPTDGLHTPGAPATRDGTKQRGEFHAIAIFGRRAGGNQYTALDVTDPSNPTFLWSFPTTGSDDARFMGESWTDFAPRPPPIVPVRLKATSTSPQGDRDRGFSERWVVMFGGGYDPTLTLGRAVFMLDAWTGETVWRFTDEDFKVKLAFSGSSAPSMFPVAGGVAPLDIGTLTSATLDVDGFSDTATWGDLGGNLFVARLHVPGELGASGRVENWFAARAFEQLRRTDDAQYVSDPSGAGRNEFFYMTANAFDPSTRSLHTYLGSGNRERLMRPSTQWCGTDSLFGCCQGGCTSVTAATTERDGACTHTDTFSCAGAGGLLTHSSVNTCPPEGTSCAAAPGGVYARDVNVSWTCPGAGTTSVTGSALFDGSGLGSVAPVGQKWTTSASLAPPTHNRFYGIRSYGGAPTKTFDDEATAKVFDQHRFTDVAYTGRCAGGSCTLVNTTQARVSYGSSSLSTTTCNDGSATCAATGTSPGWFYEYGVSCPLGTCDPAPPWVDEKTGAGANVILGCVMWGGFRPPATATTGDPCPGPHASPTVYDYTVNYLTGTPSAQCKGDVSGGIVRFASERSLSAAPGGPDTHVDISPDGTIRYSGGQTDSGSDSSRRTAGTRPAAGTPIYWLQVPQQLHTCRHVSSASCN